MASQGLVRKPSTTSVAGTRKVAGPSRPPSRQQTSGRPPTTHGTTRERAREATPSASQERHIQVVVRCRALSWQEIEEKSEECVSVEAVNGSEVTIASLPAKPSLPPAGSASLSSITNQPTLKTYAFDHVFGPSADQGSVYNEVVAPLLDEVLQGYNCTCLCYGQTGTGKTYTMEGDLNPSLGTYSPQAGIIPRTLHRLFEMLHRDHHDFAVKVSFIELYNEELRDLNAPGDMAVPLAQHQPMSRAAPPPRGTTQTGAKAEKLTHQQQQQPELKIFDDNLKRGVVVQGAEETGITTVNEGIRILTRGSDRRQAASTQVNEHSSRSHSIFTITVHLKETSEVGQGVKTGGSEDTLKIGKLHLVDLAGSENVGRSGAQAGRAREAGMINQSLLTLGRVINALVERNAHVPYRESKLTRILQDSLGGRTKTCIIATISPAQVNYDETLSTLDYAMRAKAIQNRPEANQRMTKAALLSQYSIEIERLKADLFATRTKNGIFVSQGSWDSLSEKHEETRKEAELQRRHAGAYQMQLAARTEEFEQSCRLLGVRESELKSLMHDLDKTNADLAYRNAELGVAQRAVVDETILRQAHDEKRQEWKGWAKRAIEDTDNLRAKIARKHAVELRNIGKAASAEVAFGTATDALREQMSALKEQQDSFSSAVRDTMSGVAKNARTVSEVAAQNLVERTRDLDTARSLVQAQFAELSEAGAVLASATDHTRTEFIDDARERADEFRAACTKAFDTLLDRHQNMFEASFASMEQILKVVEQGHAATVEKLERNIKALELRKEAEETRLKAEIDRLEECTAGLEVLQIQRNAAAEQLREKMMASINSQLDDWCSSQQREQHTAFENLRSTTSSAKQLAEQSAAERMASHTELIGNERGALEELAAVERRLESVAVDIKESLETTAGDGRAEIDHVGLILSEEIGSNERAFAVYEDLAVADTASYRQSVQKQKVAVDETVDALVGTAHACLETAVGTIADLSAAIATSADDLTVTLEDHLEITDGALTLFTARISSMSLPTLDVDVATGQTPHMRNWPAVLDEDELDGGREQLLARLRDSSVTPVPLAAPDLSSITVPPAVKLEIPLGAATSVSKQGVHLVRRSVLSEKAPNQSVTTGKKGLHDSLNRT